MIYNLLKLQAFKSDESISKLIKDAVKYQILEDLEDVKDVKVRESEPDYSFDELVSTFKAEGRL